MTPGTVQTMVAPPAAPAASTSVQRWVVCIAALETAYAPLAAARGEALAPHTPAERRAVAALAVHLGIEPGWCPSSGAGEPSLEAAVGTPDPAPGATGVRDLVAVGGW